jgi:hypothetical protein
MDILAEHEAEGAESARDEAIAQVEANADREWKTAALGAVRWLAANRVEFTSDDVWRLLPDQSAATTHEPRALGAVMRKAARDGLVRKTDRVVNSTRVECHARPVAVWQSLVMEVEQ